MSRTLRVYLHVCHVGFMSPCVRSRMRDRHENAQCDNPRTLHSHAPPSSNPLTVIRSECHDLMRDLPRFLQSQNLTFSFVAVIEFHNATIPESHVIMSGCHRISQLQNLRVLRSHVWSPWDRTAPLSQNRALSCAAVMKSRNVTIMEPRALMRGRHRI